MAKRRNSLPTCPRVKAKEAIDRALIHLWPLCANLAALSVLKGLSKQEQRFWKMCFDVMHTFQGKLAEPLVNVRFGEIQCVTEGISPSDLAGPMEFLGLIYGRQAANPKRAITADLFTDILAARGPVSMNLKLLMRALEDVKDLPPLPAPAPRVALAA